MKYPILKKYYESDTLINCKRGETQARNCGYFFKIRHKIPLCNINKIETCTRRRFLNNIFQIN